MSIKLLIADDHEVVRCGLRSVLAGGDIEIIGEATTGEQAIQMALEKRPDVLLLDIRMPGGDGLNVLGRLKLEAPAIAVLILSTYDNPTYVARAVALGAAGYVLKGTDRAGLIEAIRKAAVGESAWTRDELRRVTGALGHASAECGRRSAFDAARKRSAAAAGARPDQQRNRPGTAHQLRNGERTCAAHPAQSGRLRPNSSRCLGGAKGIGVRERGSFGKQFSVFSVQFSSVLAFSVPSPKSQMLPVHPKPQAPPH